ncbi:TonB-dependent siderophore receptor [Sphingomonas sp. C3-2]|uniref:TonB-dependent siderophore receptor n=1 Tax=Sphingomonas sp. C3-2 TaxID=3062169 RepID=UPI00294B61C4|nr:TonB-dependent receptor [Sphingomonas sp. C3-2]WOK36986.1 TonB-dependent receptor [Sphingomonas sp. C3-2]
MPTRLAPLACALGMLALPGASHAQLLSSAATDTVVPGTVPCDPAPSDTAPCPAPGLVEIPLLDPAEAERLFPSARPLSLQESLRYAASATLDAYGLDPRGDYGFVRGLEAPVVQDGLTRPFGIRNGSRPEYFTLDRLELLRGPAATLRASGAGAGMVDIATKRPEFISSVEAYAATGSYQRREAGIDLTGPVAGDALAGRIIALRRKTAAQSDYVGDSRTLVNAALDWRPDADTSLLLAAQFQRDESGWAGLFLPNIARPADIAANDAPFLAYRQSSTWLSARFAHQLSANVEVRQSLRVEWLTTRAPRDLDQHGDKLSTPCAGLTPGQPLQCSPAAARQPARLRLFGSDTQLTADLASGPFLHRITAGVDYASLHDNNDRPDRLTRSQQKTGFYAQFETRLEDAISLALGARHDRAEQRTDMGWRTHSATSGHVTLTGDLGHGLLPYASYSESFLPIAGVDADGQSLAPQRARVIETGLRWRPHARTHIGLALYDMVDRNRLIADFTAPWFVHQAGRVKSHGVEIEASQRIGSLELVASFNHARARETETGLRPVAVPRQTATLWANNDIALSDTLVLRLGAGARYITEGYDRAAGLGDPEYLIADALILLESEQWSFTLNAANLFNQRGYTSCLGRGECFDGLPRTISAAIAVRF